MPPSARAKEEAEDSRSCRREFECVLSAFSTEQGSGVAWDDKWLLPSAKHAEPTVCAAKRWAQKLPALLDTKNARFAHWL